MGNRKALFSLTGVTSIDFEVKGIIVRPASLAFREQSKLLNARRLPVLETRNVHAQVCTFTLIVNGKVNEFAPEMWRDSTQYRM